jgi:hypothetical protein
LNSRIFYWNFPRTFQHFGQLQLQLQKPQNFQVKIKFIEASKSTNSFKISTVNPRFKKSK